MCTYTVLPPLPLAPPVQAALRSAEDEADAAAAAQAEQEAEQEMDEFTKVGCAQGSGAGCVPALSACLDTGRPDQCRGPHDVGHKGCDQG